MTKEIAVINIRSGTSRFFNRIPSQIKNPGKNKK
jgi:hypothetical protein